jgi:hypothetical protein
MVLSFVSAALLAVHITGCATLDLFKPKPKEPERLAEFVVNVWDMGNLSKDNQALVLKAKECDTYDRCRSSSIIGSTLRKCAALGDCKRAERPLRLKITFSSGVGLNGEYEVVGQKVFSVPYGTKITVTVVSPKVEVPVKEYTLESREWDSDRNITPGDVARIHGHWVLSAN